MSQYREWNIDNIKYIYRGDDYRHFSSTGPPTTCRAVRPQWLTMPAMAESYGNGIPKREDIVKSKKRPHKDEGHNNNPRVPSSTVVSRDWYRRHLSPQYQLKCVGSLSKEAVSKFSEELSELLCDDASHSNLDSIVAQPDLNLVLVACQAGCNDHLREGQRTSI